jgi:capsule polysaccharide export protein KpsE/RkpR
LVTRYHAKKKSDARKYLENKVDIDSGSKDGLIRVSITDKDPAFAAEMANGYVEEFKKFLAGLAITEASRRRAFFEQQLAEAKDNLANAEEELKRTEQKTGVIQLDSQARATIELVANLRAQIAAKQAQITAMRSFATGENPELQISEQQLLGLQAEAAKIGANSEGATNPLLPKGSMQESSLEYVRKLRDVKYYETIFDLLARQFEAAKVDEARQGALVQIVDQAVVPDRRSAPKRTLMVLGFAIFGVLLGILGVFGSEGLARIAKDPRERERLELLKAHLSHKNGR